MHRFGFVVIVATAIVAASSFLAVWATATPSGRASVEWQYQIEVASGEAYQGPWRMNESDFRYVDSPTVAMFAAGDAAVAWVDQARKDVLLQLYTPEGAPKFAEPVNVSRSPHTFSWLPRIVLGSSGSEEIYVLWQEIVFSGGSHGGEIFFARSRDGGRSFSSAINLSNTPAGAGKGRLSPELWHNGSLDLVLGEGGVLYAAWTEYEGALRLSRSSNGGERFSEPVSVVEAGRGGAPARGPSLAAGSGDTLYLAWTVGEDPAADVLLARSDDGGLTFGPSARVWESTGHADAPKLALATDGTLHVAWAESPEGPGRDYEIRYTRSTEGESEFEEPRVVPGPDRGTFRGEGFPALKLDGQGHPHLLRDLFPEPDRLPLGAAIAISPDGGDNFAPAAAVPGTTDPELGFSGGLQGLLTDKLDVTEEGRVAVVHSTFLPGESSRIFLHLGEVAPRP